MYRRLLSPTDGSACSQLAFDHGVRLAKDQQAEVRIVHEPNRHGIHPRGWPPGEGQAQVRGPDDEHEGPCGQDGGTEGRADTGDAVGSACGS